MKHYKFIADSASVPYFLKGCIKFTPISELNDPSELTSNVIVEDIVASRERLCRDGYTENDLIYLQQQGHLLQQLAPDFQAISVPQTTAEATMLIHLQTNLIPTILSLFVVNGAETRSK